MKGKTVAEGKTIVLRSRDELLQELLPLELRYAEMKALVSDTSKVDYERLDCEDLQERIEILRRRLEEGGYDISARVAICTPPVCEDALSIVSTK